MAIEDDHDEEQYDSSDDDGAPEEVGKEAAARGAVEQLEREQNAKVAVTEAAKSKRRQAIERNTEQQRAKREKIITTTTSLNSIPYDLLAKVAAKRKAENEAESSESEEETSQPLTRKSKRTVFTKEQETEATTFIAVNRTSTELSDPVTSLRKDKTSCFNFRDRMLYDKRRLTRIHSGKVDSFRAKRMASKHR